ncbi:uncharacterized protein LOC143412333 [Maylandia zebra]|uniref:uncharacterized protein LOC143412333 n=1 Tax=Maylandia zebra TaxID=106582 RepID=UPI00403C232F
MFTSARYTSIYQKVFHCRPSSDAGGLPGQCWPTQRGPGSEELKKILAFLVSFLFSSYPNKTFLHLLAPKRLWCPWRSGPEACAHHVDRKHSDTILEMLTVTSEANWTTQLQQEGGRGVFIQLQRKHPETLQQPDPKLCLLVGLNVEVSNVQHLERKPRQCTVMFHQHVADAGPAFHADISREPRLPQSLPCHVLIRMIMKMSECK